MSQHLSFLSLHYHSSLFPPSLSSLPFSIIHQVPPIQKAFTDRLSIATIHKALCHTSVDSSSLCVHTIESITANEILITQSKLTSWE